MLCIYSLHEPVANPLVQRDSDRVHSWSDDPNKREPGARRHAEQQDIGVQLDRLQRLDRRSYSSNDDSGASKAEFGRYRRHDAYTTKPTARHAIHNTNQSTYPSLANKIRERTGIGPASAVHL